MPVTLRQLEIFLALAEHEHTGRAARTLPLSQSAVSMALGELENQLGRRFFERTGRGLRLNADGEQLRAYARPILRQASEIDARFADGAVAGRLHVGASSTIGIYVLPPIVARFAERYPAASVRLEIGNTREIRDRVARHTLDLGFVEGPGQRTGLDATAWRSDELVLFCGAGHPLAERGRLALEALEDVRWVLREEGSGTRKVFEHALGEDAHRLERVLELGHSEAVRRAVEAGAGVGCLSRRIVAGGIERGALAAIQAPPSWSLQRTFWRIQRRSAPGSRLAEAFVEACAPGGS